CSFFFQAEDGIRDRNVTGVQTCGLPISTNAVGLGSFAENSQSSRPGCHHVRCGYDHPLSMAVSDVEFRWRIAAGRDEVRPGAERRARGLSIRDRAGGRLAPDAV